MKYRTLYSLDPKVIASGVIVMSWRKYVLNVGNTKLVTRGVVMSTEREVTKDNHTFRPSFAV